MPLKLVVDAVEGRLAAGWDKCPVIGINTDTPVPRDGSSHLLVQYPVARSGQITLGSPGANVWREEGAFRLVLNMAKGGGIGPALAWTDELAALFRGQVFGTVRCFGPSSPAIDDRNDRGNYYQLSLSVPYEADVIG